MTFSALDIFSIGIGPSSSHTVGPMRATGRFLGALADEGVLSAVTSVTVHLYGSLAATGKSHGTDVALLLALEGESADRVDVDKIACRVAAIREDRRLRLAGTHPIAFVEGENIVFHRREQLPRHPNALRFIAADSGGAALLSATYYSVGGGFVVEDGAQAVSDPRVLPYPFASAGELLAHCANLATSISGVMAANERALHDGDELRAGLLAVWGAMRECIDRGMAAEGVLPGYFQVPRRARALHDKLRARAAPHDDLHSMDWLNLFALAVSEENAAGGRVVTAPTNGAAGIVPAVLRYYLTFVPGAREDRIVDFLLVASAIAMLCKQAASISGAEVGCQGEVGSACAMAAGALCEVLGGSPQQVENAAEIAIEHHLGLTCDPVGGFVQIPCIERNAVAAVTAVNAARIALAGDGRHIVSLDKALETMRQTGNDMKRKYKETSRGGLAVNVTEC